MFPCNRPPRHQLQKGREYNGGREKGLGVITCGLEVFVGLSGRGTRSDVGGWALITMGCFHYLGSETGMMRRKKKKKKEVEKEAAENN